MFEKMENRLDEAIQARHELFFRSMATISGHIREQRFFFGFGALICLTVLPLVVFLAPIHDRSIPFFHWITTLCALTGIFCIGRYVMLLEKERKEFARNYEYLLDKYSREILVLEDFKEGKVDIDAIREMYKADSVGIESRMRFKHRDSTSEWAVFISLATCAIFFVASF